MPKKTNIEINGNSYYRVTATIGKDTGGKPIRKQFYGSSKKEAEAKRDEYMSSINKGLSANFDKALFGNVFKAWLEEIHKPSISLSTYANYHSCYRLRIKDSSLSSLRLTDIKSMHVQAYYSGLLDNGCGTSALELTHKILTVFFNYCLKADLIIKSPLLAVKLPQNKRRSDTNKPIPEYDIEKYLAAANDDINYCIFVFVIFSGLRIGEALALTHEDINGDVIKVNKSVGYIEVNGKWKHILGDTKTPESMREVPILDEIKPLLKLHIKCEKEKHIRLGIPFSNERILFSSHSCGYRSRYDIRDMLNRLSQRIGAEKTTLHSLRHTFCTILAKQGVPLKTASELMGHSNIGITAKIYTHVDTAEKKKGIEKLSVYFKD